MCETKMTVQYPRNNCGFWLSKNGGTEAVNLSASEGTLYLGYNSPNTNELGAARIALSFLKGPTLDSNDGKIELQYFTGDKKGDIKWIDVDNTLVYNLFYNLLKELEAKALALQPVKPVVK